MTAKTRVQLGIQAGLLGGTLVAALFFILDLAHFQPLATPLALSARLLGPTNPVLEFPVLSRLVSVALFAGNLLTFSLLHFLAFSLLGVCAVWGCEASRIPLNAVTGAVYGMVGGTLVFFGCMALCGTHLLEAPTGIASVALANLAAGFAMGGWVQMMRDRASGDSEGTVSPAT